MANAPTALGRYQIVEELGRGAMGVVYLAVDPMLARPVAIKLVREAERMAPAELQPFRARFRQEAEAAGRLSHPDIVRVFDIGDSYIVMEYVDGHTLGALLRAGTSLRVRQILDLLRRVADALDYAHRNGVVHRDVKPSNVMLVGAADVKVMDFGVARLDGSNLTAVGSVVGSVRYMAPEQMMGEKVDGRADVFSLAAVAYELLTTQPPFSGKTITDVVSRVVRGAFEPPSALSGLPVGLNALFARAFAVRPAERFQRAADFARELQETLRPAMDFAIVHSGSTESPTDVDSTATEARLRPEAGAAAGAHPNGGEPAKKATDQTMIVEAPKREGILLLESEPSGASVFVDGEPIGITPLGEHALPFGRHRIRLEAPRCEPATIELELWPERPLRAVSASLAPSRPRDGSLRAGQFVPFGPDVLPPCRVGGALPAYPSGARERGLAGSPVVEVWVGQKGEVMDLALVESAGAILDGALLDAVSRWRFTPARVRGVPVSVRITVQHHFSP